MTVKVQKFIQRLHNIRDTSGRFREVQAIETRKETKGNVTRRVQKVECQKETPV